MSGRQGRESKRGLVTSTVGSAAARLAGLLTVLFVCSAFIPPTRAWGLTGSDGGAISQRHQEVGLGMAACETGELLQGWELLGLGEGAGCRLCYRAAGALAPGGGLLETGPRYEIPGKVYGARSAEEAEMLRTALGRRRVALDATLTLAPGASLISRHDSARDLEPGSGKHGLTTTDVGHLLRWEVGPRSQLTASLEEHREEWAGWVAKPGASRRTRGLGLKSEFGGGGRHSLRLGLTATETKGEGRDRLARVREAHLGLAPVGRLRLEADYVAKESDGGADETARSVGAVLRLSPGAELSAAVKGVAVEGRGERRESALALHTKLGAGGSAGELDAEERVSRGEGEGLVRHRKWMLAGGIGRGSARTELKANFEEKRGEGPSGEVAREVLVQVDRALGGGLKLRAERRQRVRGAGAAPEVTAKSSCGVEAALRPGTSLEVGLMSEEKPSGRRGWARRVAVRQDFHKLALRAEHEVGGDAGRERGAVSYGIDAPVGELTDWAKEISGGHEFSEAGEYLIDDRSDWMEMPFAGYRFLAERRRGGEDGGVDTLAFAHRRMIGDRYHLRLSYQRFPEGKEGGEKGRPMALERGRVEIGMPIWRGLMGRGSYQRESSLSPAGGGRERVSLGFWGRLSEGERVEVSVSRGDGSWEGEGRQESRVSLLYALEVSDGHRLHVKVGWGWADGESGGGQRERRVGLGYVKPI